MKTVNDYQATIDTSKQKGLIAEGDKYCFCYWKPKEEYVGGFTKTTFHNVDVLFVVNENEAKILHVDKTTGQLTGRLDIVGREEMDFLWTSKFFSWDINLNATKQRDYRENFEPAKRFRGWMQDDLQKEVVDFIKERYIIPYKEAKKAKKLAKKNKQ